MGGEGASFKNINWHKVHCCKENSAKLLEKLTLSLVVISVYEFYKPNQFVSILARLN